MFNAMLITVFLLYLAVLMLVARLLSEKMADMSDFFLAGQKLSGVFIAMTFAASWFGAGSTIGTMNMAFQEGLGALWLIAIPTFCSFIIIATVLARRIRRLNLMTIPEAIEHHYGPVGSFLLSWIILCSITTFIAAQLVAAGSLMEMTTGLSPLYSQVLVYGVIVIYSIIGGFRAVVMTDVLQVVFFSLGIAILFVFAFMHPETLPQSHIPATHWQLGTNLKSHLFMTLTFVLAWSIAPEMWQRMAAVRHENEAARSVILAGALLLVLYAMVTLTGIQALAILTNPDNFTRQNVLLSLANQLPSPWLMALVLVGVLSAICSTIDSSLNAGCMTLVRNIVHRNLCPQATNRQLVVFSQISTLLIGIPGILIALFYQDLIQILWKSADIYASTMFVPVMGIFFFSRAGRLAGILAMVLGAIPVIIGFYGDLFPGSLPSWWPLWPYTTLLGVGLSLIGFATGCLLENRLEPAGAPHLTAENRESVGV